MRLPLSAYSQFYPARRRTEPQSRFAGKPVRFASGTPLSLRESGRRKVEGSFHGTDSLLAAYAAAPQLPQPLKIGDATVRPKFLDGKSGLRNRPAREYFWSWLTPSSGQNQYSETGFRSMQEGQSPSTRLTRSAYYCTLGLFEICLRHYRRNPTSATSFEVLSK
jgi:hypothetical protein